MRLVCVLDCADPDRLAAFWAAALRYRRQGDGPAAQYVSLLDPLGRGPELLLQRVPEPKDGKNRMHLDLRVPGAEGELDRLLRIGATRLRGPFDEDGWVTTVLADPEGNEFCLVVPPEGPERSAAA
ncbi:VOC family protein [Allostreptomyces psammosilenae]|uniref:Putative enzyme related to lactoylglutathione lyase n=1 Tax=Allostreptomyces psammosilenae TaxID=1892865 RepID=A0A853A302_9ACTN|nr:VOC family protein [Allostreptomyces psammosilenae]NYI04892.1 putative enzyme related to lactoylglutathione lyase [Allostreptomyces psammosilenae]